MSDRSDGKRWGWMTKRLAGFVFAMAFLVFIGLVSLTAIGPLTKACFA